MSALWHEHCRLRKELGAAPVSAVEFVLKKATYEREIDVMREMLAGGKTPLVIPDEVPPDPPMAGDYGDPW